MRINELTIGEFKNLSNFKINFNEDALISVLIGCNGSGKSNLLEALITIFRDLDLGDDPAFEYRLDYSCRGHKIHIDADRGRPKKDRVLVTVDGERMSYRRFWDGPEREYLPNYVFGYYSGIGGKMEALFEKHQVPFYKELLRGVDNPLRTLLYARLEHAQFVLLSFFIEQDEKILQFLDRYLGIQGLDSVLFTMREPPWSSKEGDAHFWNVRGVLRDFLNKLYEVSLVPLRVTQRVNLNFKQSTTLEHMYFYLQDENALRELYKFYNDQRAFFKALESTYISDVLGEVQTRVVVRNAQGLLTFRDLSEGEQQLLMVLGLLRFTRDEESLFLLDEPDTHLNPAWAIRYPNFVDQIAGTQETSQIIMTTHNPLVISSLKKQQVRMMLRNENTGYIYAEEPDEGPQGMGMDAMLTSELFGLRSSLDIPTQELLDERRRLIVKETLSIDERQRLEELNEALSGIDFSVGNHDPEYARFIRRKVQREDEAIREMFTLTPQQIKEQNALVEEILDELEEEEQQA
ncbi:MAG TPA: AAA family ATPase [Ktedonobacteraceae bacterium]|nr:AAA family ATPase [Ktedonobacteraceae bacterium]